MKLSPAQKQNLYDKGYAKLPGIVPQNKVHDALRAINHDIVTKGIPPDQLPIFHSQTFCPDLRNKPVITDLFNDTPALAAAESLLGEGMVIKPGGGQMALRFPSYPETPRVGGPHVDGTYSPTNGVTKGEIHHFTMLAAVFLSQVPEPFCGNFSIWPGTHRVFADYFRKHGPQSLIDGMPKVEMPEPEQIMAEPGDVVFAHYTLAHSVAANISPNIRYAIFFRIYRVGHNKLGSECMTNIWAEWPGMWDVLPADERARAQGAVTV